MGFITEIIGATTLRILMLLGMTVIANLWAEGKLEKPIAKLKKFKKTHGIFTVGLIILWWLLTPSGLPDDFITLWLIDQYGMTAYVMVTGLLTAYLIYRLKISLVIYKSRRGK